ncbi:MAG: efflux transporter outer membrane subunit [Desulfuromonadales bacterium]|nr:efflux transporter outer membrane subunit [Desulfuromonadales bacterium]
MIIPLLFGLLLVLNGCSLTPDRSGGPLPLAESFSQSGEQIVADRWWQEFGDPELDALIEHALRGNFTLRGFWARLDQARAVARKAGADRLPTLTAEAGAATVRRDGDGGHTVSDSYNLGLFAGYEVDLWGKIRAGRAAAVADADASFHDLQAAAISLASQVASSWLRLIELRGRMALLDAQNSVNEKSLQLLTERFRAGQIGIADLLQQRQLIEATRGETAQVLALIKVTEHQLAILLGGLPGQTPSVAQTRLADLPPLPATGLPAGLVQRRPDLLSSWSRLQAADRRLAVADVERLPNLGLVGRVETSAEHVRELFDNWLASLAANLVGPIIDGGRRRAEVDRTAAVVAQAWSDYRQVVLTALGEVEDALVREEQQRRFLEILDRQTELAGQALQRIRDRYRQGIHDYQRVLTAEISLQSLQRRQLTAHRELLDIRIDLYRALGGGWELQRPADELTVGALNR